MNTQTLLEQAAEMHRAGRLLEAGQIYHRVLAADPMASDAWNLVGVLAHQVGQSAEAIAHIGRAIQLRPDAADYHLNLASALMADGKPAEAEASCRRCLRIASPHVTAWNVLGNSLVAQSRHDEAFACFERVLQRQPDDAEALCNLGSLRFLRGELAEAERLQRRAVELNPRLFQAWSNLGAILRALGRRDEAVSCLQQALTLQPHSIEVLVNLGNVHHQQGDHVTALDYLQQALARDGEHAGAWNALGVVLQELTEYAQAADCFRRALEKRPECAAYGSNYLYCLNLFDDWSPEEVGDEHRAWGQQFTEIIRRESAPFTDWPRKNSARRLRIGYVSPDFRSHPLNSFFEPILHHHDRERFEICCYAEVASPDRVTRRLREASDMWRSTCGLSDRQMAERIHADEIDILVDLAGHTANNRLAALVHKPAPVQVSMLGYFATTGLAAVDYYVTDETRAPAGAERQFVERLVRLPGGGCCWQPPLDSPKVRPRQTDAPFTFGSTHRLDKLTDGTLDLWAAVLQANPKARLLIFRTSLAGSPGLREQIVERLAARGLAPARIELAWETSGSYLEAYHRMDVLLDVVPWGAGTTVYESLWMGVPLPTWCQPRPAMRGAASALHRLGLDDLIADSFDDFVTVASRLAQDASRLAELRRALRERVRETLANAERFTRELEAAYEWMAGG
ncbi:MAG: tetratricopeptide repeat protein [Planctomycetales bacterium]|nr:tetratricopeptide repeat protein [Planctomycetales bacterium]